jgi:Asp-tRNA(Asn)/Glu-tRNA(Gln) amidotransferase A subunit family amidase
MFTFDRCTIVPRCQWLTVGVGVRFMTYRRSEVKAPKLSGVALKAFVGVLESAPGAALANKLMADSGINTFRETPVDAPPVQCPLPHPAGVLEKMDGTALAKRALQGQPTSRETVAHFARDYSEGKADPVTVQRKLNAHIERLDSGDNRMGFFIARKPDEVLRAAEESAQRLAKKAPLSVLDGVPVVIKDEMDWAGYPTTLGTKFLNEVAKTDSTVVARLKAAGAIIVGKANMNEIGINPIGLNPHHGAARNPWNRGHITGGSSSASASVVAAGICPISIGCDGGGSIRIPAGLCGIVGLKATFGRIPETGIPPLCFNVGHVGPMGKTVADVAALYAILAGKDDHDVMGFGQPNVNVDNFDVKTINSLRIGVCWPYFEDADPQVVAACKKAIDALKAQGATVVEIGAPNLNTILWSHATIILSEMATTMLPHTTEDTKRFALDSRTNLALGRNLKSTDLVHAMRHRHQLTREYLQLMKTVDVIVTPTTAITAPPIPESTLPDGESNLPVVDALMRYIRVANLTGFPGIAVPCGFDSNGLPISVHFLGRPWEESLLLQVAHVVEAASEKREPAVSVRVLE